MAFADNAFQAEFSRPEQIYDLVIPPEKDRLNIRWKKIWQDRPITRDIERTPEGIQISDTEPFDYGQYRNAFRNLGWECGLREYPELYHLRRPGGKLITGKHAASSCNGLNGTLTQKRILEALTSEECNQIMGHRSRSTYQRYYAPRNSRRDVANIFCGLITRDYIMKAMQRLSRDQFAPKSLNKVQLSEVNNIPKLLELAGKRNDYKQQIHALGYDKILDARGKSGLYDKYNQAKAKFNAKKSLLKDKRLKALRDEYFETVDTQEINNQLKGIMPRKTFIPPTVEYELADRATAAQLLFEPVDSLEASELFQRRIVLVKCLTRLCHQRESPRPYQARNMAANLQLKGTQKPPRMASAMVIDEPDILDMPVQGLICGFCRWDKKPNGWKKRYHVYPRIDNLEKHVERWHFKGQSVDEVKRCPYPDCTAILGSSKTYMNHAERRHCLR